MASGALNPCILRSSPAHEVTTHLRDVLRNSNEDTITRELLHLIGTDSIAPAPFAQWLGVATSPATLRAAFVQTASIQVRKFAFKKLGKLLSTTQWQETWDALGGVSGWLDLSSDFSVQDVKQACRVFARNTRGVDTALKREYFTDLFKALLPSLFPDEHRKLPANEDRRQLRAACSTLIPACTSQVVARMVSERWDEFKVYERKLLVSHADTLQDLATQYVFGGNPAGKRWLTALLSEYPNAASEIPGISKSMQFSLSLLEKLATEDAKTSLGTDRIVKELFEPLLKRALNKKIDWSITKRIVDLFLLYSDQNPDTAEAVDVHRSGFVRMIGKCWSSKPDMFSEQFKRILELPYLKKDKKDLFGDTVRLGLEVVPKPRRYALLRFICQSLYYCDLENDADIRVAALPPLTNTLLNTALPPEDALALFTRMRSARGDVDLVDSHAYCYEINDSVDMDMWHAVLLFRSGRYADGEVVARKSYEARKKAAISSAGQEQRAINARSAIDYATVSGSLHLCMEAHQWARRFVRDPLTIKELYCAVSTEFTSLLSGIPRYLDKSTSVLDLRNRVETANKLLLLIFETTCLALREPAFKLDHFRGAIRLFASVVRDRMKQASRLKKTIGTSDEELYLVLWADTLKMLITVEEKGLSPGHEKLFLNTAWGVLNHAGSENIDLEDEEPETFRFFDDLAKARDQLWRKHRLSTHPATATLPEPFPRGLPLQNLIEPYVILVPDAHSCAPYIASRMETALFPDRAAALITVPEDRDSCKAIHTHFDKYSFALRMFLPMGISEDEKKKRVHRVWSYVIGPLSEKRFSPAEAVRYWETGPWSAPDVKLYVEKETEPMLPDWPVVPKVEDVWRIEEWSPIPAEIRYTSERKLERVTYIDISKHPTLRIMLTTVDHVVPGVDILSHRQRRAKAKPAIREGQILLVMSYLDSLLPQSQSFNRPFPPTEWDILVRYPAVYLEGELLSSLSEEQSQLENAFSLLGANLANVPSSLIAELANNAYSALTAADEKDDGYIDLESRTWKLLKMLTRCDRPSLASNMVVRMVLGRPQNSSWHRELLSHRFLRRLPARGVRDCIENLSKAIITRIEQSATAETDSEGGLRPRQNGRKQPSPSAVKVSTVKLLAQLLGDMECVPEHLAFSILSELIDKASHVDIRCAAVNSLLKYLRFASSERTQNILDTLQVVVPVAGNLRERRLITEAEWTHAENTLKLPELDDEGLVSETTPILWSILSFLKNSPPGCLHFEHQSAFISRLILPIITKLKYQTARWTSLFLKAHGLDFASQQELNIPTIPRNHAILCELLRSAAPYLPQLYLDDLVAYRTFNIAPPETITALNKRLKEDQASSSNPAVGSWLARYALGVKVSVSHFKMTSLLDIIDNGATSSSTRGEITVKAVQTAYLKLYTVILLHETHLPNVLREHRVLWPFAPSDPIPKSWEAHFRPLIQAIILYVESLRTRDWERDPKRHPAILPDTFILRMHLLQYSAQHSDHPPNSEEHCAAFAARIAKLIDQISNGLYHHKFLELKTSLKYVRGDDRLRVACYLGDISKTRLSWLTLQDHLRVELAASLLFEDSRAASSKDALNERVEALKQSWRASESEEVRKAGYNKS